MQVQLAGRHREAVHLDRSVQPPTAADATPDAGGRVDPRRRRLLGMALGTAVAGLGSGLAVVAYMYLIQQAGPVRASVVTYMAPPIGVVLGWAVLGEDIGWNLVLALGCILAGVALVQRVGVGWFRARTARVFGAAATE